MVRHPRILFRRIPQTRRVDRCGRIAALLVALCASPLDAAEKPTVEDVRSAWLARQERVQTAVFEWSEERLFTKGSIDDSSSLANGGPYPPEDASVVIDSNVFGFDDRGRVFLETAAWDPPAGGKGGKTIYRSAFNGQVSVDYFPPANVDFAVGTIYDSDGYKEIRSIGIRPLLLVYRPFAHNMLRADLSTYSVLPDDAAVNGIRCIILRQDAPPGRRVQESYFLDPSRQFLPLRFLSTHSGKPTVQIDIEFTSDAKFGFVPSGWKLLFLRPSGAINTSQVATVQSVAINDPISDDQFEIEFPPGTWVRDARTKDQYIVRADSTRRRITPDELERDLSYEQLLSSDSGGMNMPRWFLGVNVVIVLLLVLSLGYRRWRRYRTV